LLLLMLMMMMTVVILLLSFSTLATAVRPSLSASAFVNQPISSISRFARQRRLFVLKNELDSESSDYLLQTEDYSILKSSQENDNGAHQQNGRHEPNHSAYHLSRDLQKYLLTQADDDWDHQEGGKNHDNEHALSRVKRHMMQIPRRWGPGWQQHHHATVNFVHRVRGSSSSTSFPQEINHKHHHHVEHHTDYNDHDFVARFPLPSSSPWVSPDHVQSASISSRSPLVSHTPEWQRLQQHAQYIEQTHLRDLIQDPDRSQALYATTEDGVYLDYSRQRVTLRTMQLLFELAERQDLAGKIRAMVQGETINFTEKRAVLHTALRADKSQIGSILLPLEKEGDEPLDVVAEVHQVLDQIKAFTNGVRSGEIVGYTGKRLRNIVSVGIGGSYLGPEFVHECLKTEPEGINSALGYNLRFLSNVDPVDVERTCADLDPEETLIVIVSKTFTTAETMLNARTMRQWLWDFMGNDKEVVRKHMVACASVSATDQVKAFGIDTDNYFFRFWDWVGGRYSVCSAAGAVPISLLYGFDLFEKFLQGAHSIDEHFVSAPFDKNIPVLMGLLGVWNMSFLKYNSRTTLPYAEALLKLPAHIQQLDMESNGKSMTKHGVEVDYPVGEIDFGEAGTNGQHSFYQLLHMGQTVPCDFIGFVQSQHDFCLDGEELSSHDELMANFFAQPDALANGKTADEVRAEGVDEELIDHRVFKGNRPSLSLLLPKLTAYACGQILAIYEHRTAVQGFIWDINSFDQWGVELGKKLALEVKNKMLESRRSDEDNKQIEGTNNPATTRLLNYYLEHSRTACQDQQQGNSLTRVTRNTHGQHQQFPPPPPPLRHDLGRRGSTLS